MTPGELNRVLSGMAESVAMHLLPNGRREGRSWCVGSVNGEKGQSLRVCISGAKQGVWSDFSSNGKGGDLLSLWGQVRGISFVETLREAKEFAGVVDDEPQFYPRKKRRMQIQKPKCEKPKNTVMDWFNGRGVFEKALSAYKVGQQGSTIVFPFISPENELELVKYRDLDAERNSGKKKIWSNSDPEYHLWGWQAISDDDRIVVICEGEIDALSWYMQGFPALSVPQGAGSGDKQDAWIKNDYDRLQRFETIYVSMDMDKAGEEAIPQIVSRLGADRCRVVSLDGYKDGNEAHASGELLGKYIESAKTRDPDELKQLSAYHDEIMSEFQGTAIVGMRLPWEKTHRDIRLRPSEISVWAGINSHGKSIALSHVCVDGVAQGERFCIASMEMKPRKLGRKMYQQILGFDNPSDADGMKAVEFLTDHVWMFEAYGTTKAERVLEVFAYARKRYGVTHFIVDSLAKCGFGEDDYNGQKAFVDRLMEFAGEHDVHVHLVVHMRKRDDENKIPGKMDIKGTGAITDMVHNVFIWWRNKPKEEDNKPQYDFDAALNCVKQRETGVEPLLGFYWHGESCQFLNSEYDPPKEYVY